MTTNNASRRIAELLEKSEGRMVTVTFTKKDGTERVLNGRLGVTKHLRGGSRTTDPAQYVSIYDTVNKGYRSVNKDTIKTLKMDGITLSVSS